MKKKNGNHKPGFFERFASNVSKATGSNLAIVSTFAIIVLWLISRPFFELF